MRRTAGWERGSCHGVSDEDKWLVHGGRLVDDKAHVRVSLADVELPNQVRFTQYVFRMRRCATTVVLDDAVSAGGRSQFPVGITLLLPDVGLESPVVMVQVRGTYVD